MAIRGGGDDVVGLRQLREQRPSVGAGAIGSHGRSTQRVVQDDQRIGELR